MKFVRYHTSGITKIISYLFLYIWLYINRTCPIRFNHSLIEGNHQAYFQSISFWLERHYYDKIFSLFDTQEIYVNAYQWLGSYSEVHVSDSVVISAEFSLAEYLDLWQLISLWSFCSFPWNFCSVSLEFLQNFRSVSIGVSAVFPLSTLRQWSISCVFVPCFIVAYYV